MPYINPFFIYTCVSLVTVTRSTVIYRPTQRHEGRTHIHSSGQLKIKQLTQHVCFWIVEASHDSGIFLMQGSATLCSHFTLDQNKSTEYLLSNKCFYCCCKIWKCFCSFAFYRKKNQAQQVNVSRFLEGVSGLVRLISASWPKVCSNSSGRRSATLLYALRNWWLLQPLLWHLIQIIFSQIFHICI